MTVGERFRVLVKAEDRWGNPSQSYRGRIEFSADGIDTAPGVTLGVDEVDPPTMHVYPVLT